MPAENTELLDAMADQIRNVIDACRRRHPGASPRYVAAPGSYPCIDMYPGDVSRGTDAAAFGLHGEFLFTVRVTGADERRRREPGAAAQHDGRP